MKFNEFNLKNRPFVKLGDISGEAGNSLNMANNFYRDMKKEGFPEEATYFSDGSNSVQESFKKMIRIGVDFNFIQRMIYNISETDVEMIKKAEENIDDDEEIILVRKKNKKTSPEEKNYLNRGSHFYTTSSNMKEEYIKHIDEFFDKDKIGMTVLDHYLLSNKYEEFCVAIQYAIFNSPIEDYQKAISNEVFDFNIIESVSQKNPLLTLHLNMAKYTISENPDFVENTVETLKNYLSKQNKRSEKEIKQVVDEVFSIMDIVSFMSQDLESLKVFKKEIGSFCLDQDSAFGKIIEKISNSEYKKEIKALFEKHIILDSISTNSNELENEQIKVNKRRL